MTEKELCQKAIDMLDMAYIPYSHFPVGAALECSDGTVYTGCNIENAAYGATICAGRSDDYCVPCGTCRQVMMEFAPNMEVLCINKAGDARKFALKELLPYGFDQSWL